MTAKELLGRAYAVENHQGQWFACQIGSVHNLDLLIPLMDRCIPQRQPSILVFHSEQLIDSFLEDPNPSLSGVQGFVSQCRTAGSCLVLTADQMFNVEPGALLPAGDGEWIEQIRQLQVTEPLRLESATEAFCLSCASTDQDRAFRMISASIRNYAVAGLKYDHPVHLEGIRVVVSKGQRPRISMQGSGSGVAVFDDPEMDPLQLMYWVSSIMFDIDLPEGQWPATFYPYASFPMHENSDNIHRWKKKESVPERTTPFDVLIAIAHREESPAPVQPMSAKGLGAHIRE